MHAIATVMVDPSRSCRPAVWSRRNSSLAGIGDRPLRFPEVDGEPASPRCAERLTRHARPDRQAARPTTMSGRRESWPLPCLGCQDRLPVRTPTWPRWSSGVLDEHAISERTFRTCTRLWTGRTPDRGSRPGLHDVGPPVSARATRGIVCCCNSITSRRGAEHDARAMMVTTRSLSGGSPVPQARADEDRSWKHASSAESSTISVR